MTRCIFRPIALVLIATVWSIGLCVVSPADASAARCKSFVYEVNFGPIQIYDIHARNLTCAKARQLIRAGSPPASTYNWIEGYTCGAGYRATGFKCRKGRRTIEWRFRLR